MKKFLSIVLSLAMLLTSTAFSVPMAVTTESAKETVVETPSDEKAAALTEDNPVVTTAPGINLLTGGEGLWDFESATDTDVAAVFTPGAATSSVSVANDPTNAENQVFAVTSKNSLGTSGQAYPQAFITIPDAIEADRPLFVNYKYYRLNSGTVGTDYYGYNALWFMKEGGVINGHETSATWNHQNSKAAIAVATDLKTSKLYFQFNIANADKTSTVILFDDMAIIPAYAITYMDADGTTEYQKEYVHGVNDNGEPTNASYSLLSTGPANSDSSLSFLGWSTVQNGTTADIIETITIAGNEDFVLYPVYGVTNDPVITLKPGINLSTGTTGVWDFESATNAQVENIFTVLTNVAKVEVGSDPLDTDATDGTNKALAMVAHVFDDGNNSQKYPHVEIAVPAPYIEADRPTYITFKYYRYNPGTAGTIDEIKAGTADYIAHNALWIMKNGTGADCKIISGSQAANTGSWKSYSALTDMHSTDAEQKTQPVKNIKFEININTADKKATTLFIDDLAIVPAYAIIYMNQDGTTEYKREYVNGVDANGEPTNASHTLITDAPESTEANKQFLGWSTDGTAANIVREITIAGNTDFTLYPVYGDRYLDANAVDMLGEIGELVYFENFNELTKESLSYDSSSYGDHTIHNDITVTGYDSLRISYSGGYPSRINEYTFPEENGNKFVTVSYKGDTAYMPGVPRFYIYGVTNDKAGKYFATMDIRIPEDSPFTMLSNQAYYWGDWGSTGYNNSGHREFGFYADRHTLTADEKSGNWVTFMTDSIELSESTAAGTPTFNFGPTYDNKASSNAYTMDFDNFALYRILPRTLTLVDGENSTEVIVEDIEVDLSQYENLQDVENMFVGWKKQDGTIIPANTKNYIPKRNETLTAIYKSRYLGENATQLINSLGVPVELVFHASFDNEALGPLTESAHITQNQSNIVNDSYITGLETKFVVANTNRTKSITVIEEGNNRYYKGIHNATAEYPPATPRFFMKSGVIQNPNAYYFAVLDVNIPSQVTFKDPTTEETKTIPTAITQLSNQAHSSEGGGIPGENGSPSKFHTLTADEYDKWVTFKTDVMNVNSSNQYAAIFNFSPQYAYGTTLDYAEYEMSFDNFSLYAIVPRTVTLIDGDTSTDVTIYDINLDLTQHIPTSATQGKTFSGWKTQDGTFIPKSTNAYFVPADITLTAVWSQFASSDIDFSKYGTMVMLQDFNHESVAGNYGTLADSNGMYIPDDSNLFIDKSVWNYGGITHWWGTEYNGYTHSEAEQNGNRYMTSKGANESGHNNPSFRSNRSEAFAKPGAYYAVIDMRIPENSAATHMVNQVHARYISETAPTNSNGQYSKYDYSEFYPANKPESVTDKKGDSNKWLKLDANHKNGQWQTFVTTPYIVKENSPVPYIAYNFGLVYPEGTDYSTAVTTFDMDNYAIFYLANRTVNFNVEVNTAGTTTALVEGITLNLANYVPVTIPEGKVFQGWSETDGGALIAGNRIDIAPDGDGKTFYAVYVDEAAPKHIELQMKVSGKHGLRTISELADERTSDNIEFGYIVTRKTILEGNGIASADFKFDCALTDKQFVKGASFKKTNGNKDIPGTIWDENLGDGTIKIAGLFVGVPLNQLDDVLVFRSYITKDNGVTYTYGAVVEASIKEIAYQISGGHTSYKFNDVPDEQKEFIRNALKS